MSFHSLVSCSNNWQDLEFASDIVQKLNTILVTSPELVEFRKRLKSLETRVRVSARAVN